jgi:uncharacterized protein (TIGR03067 family)
MMGIMSIFVIAARVRFGYGSMSFKVKPMRSISAFALTFCFMPLDFTSARDQPKPAKSDSDLMQGTWMWDTDHEQSKALPRIDIEKIVVKGNKLTFHYLMGEKRFESEFEFDVRSASMPKELDIKSLREAEKGKVTPGIYEIKDQTLKIAYRGAGSSRPKSFQDESDANNLTSRIWLKKAK